MTGCLKRLISSVGTLVVLGVVAYAGWRWGGGVFVKAETMLGRTDAPALVGPQPTPQLAEETLDRIEAFRAGELAERRIELSGTDVTSIVRYALPGIVPAGVSDPGVEMEGEDLFLSARVAVSSFPDLPALSEVMGLLPDTIDIQLRAQIIPFGQDYSALSVRRVEASRIPLPSRLIPGILRAMGRVDREGLPSDAMAIPMPYGISRAFVEGGRLILTTDR